MIFQQAYTYNYINYVIVEWTQVIKNVDKNNEKLFIIFICVY